jgi:putative endonuclease
MFYVYLLQCADTTFYIGCTNNVQKRLKQHNFLKSGAKYTKMRRPVELKYVEEYVTLAEGRKREAEMKRLTRKQKERLICQLPNFL